MEFNAPPYSLLQRQLKWQKVHQIVHEAVEIETEFVCEALPCALIGLNSTLMSQYIKFVTDRLLNLLICKLRSTCLLIQSACPSCLKDASLMK